MAFVSMFFAGISSYALTSIVLLYYPQILHKRRNGQFRRCRHISHRGGAGENYENTLSAFQHAVNLGTDMLELDVHLSKDGKVVVNHDCSLLRTTGLDLRVSEVNYNELPLLNTSQTIDFDPGRSFNGSDDEESRKIPLLSEIFKAFPNVMINIDVKEGQDELIHEVNKLIIENAREHLTVWGSGQSSPNMKCYYKNPEIGRFFSLKRCMQMYLYFYTGLLPFMSINETHFEICLPETFLKFQNVGNGSDRTLFRRFIFWIVSKVICRPLLFQHLNKRGIQTYVWVLNTDEDFRRAVELGVTGIMTDYPSKLKRFLNEVDH